MIFEVHPSRCIFLREVKLKNQNLYSRPEKSKHYNKLLEKVKVS